MTAQPPIERLIAVGYGLTYDAIVRGFAPYESLLDEIVTLVSRAAMPGPPSGTRVLDISCGVGTVAERLARRGWSVVAVDPIEHLVDVARRNHRDSGLSLSFHHADAAKDAVPGGGTFDVLVSMHTLYWHPDPAALLAACRRALRPSGHAVFLTYARPAHVGRTFSEVRARCGWFEAVRSRAVTAGSPLQSHARADVERVSEVAEEPCGGEHAKQRAAEPSRCAECPAHGARIAHPHDALGHVVSGQDRFHPNAREARTAQQPVVAPI